jgi:hypothetical protein
VLTTWAWIVGGFLAVIGVGFSTAVFLFVAAYLRVEGHQSGIRSVLLASGSWVAFHAICERLLHVPFPVGWLIP